MTTRSITSEVPTKFNKNCSLEKKLVYDMELLTPMVGGGVKSWEPDFNNPVRSQSIKGHLRFWWRTMQQCNDPTTLRKCEDSLWGCTSQPSLIRLSVVPVEPVNKILFRDGRYVNYKDLPSYVLFPLQGQKDVDKFNIITGLKFQLTLHCRNEDREVVENCIKLWVLFGGIGARFRRGCGSIYCQQIMEEFASPESIKQFILRFQKEDGPVFTTAPYPHLHNSRLAWQLQDGNGDAKATWKNFLDHFGVFRQGEGEARELRKGGKNHPGPTRWPEADAIRIVTGKKPGLHGSVHPAGKWFPRAAYGLPILTKFKQQKEEPDGEYTLHPQGYDRWPSPVILKVIKLGNGDILKICLILNQSPPPSGIKLQGPYTDYSLTAAEMPLSFNGKTMPINAPLKTSTSPYEAIIEFFKLREI